MNLISVTLNYVCLFFFMFLVVIYFSKKKNMTIENIIYMGILFCTFMIITSELFFLYSCVYFKDNMFLIGYSERVSALFLNVFFILLGAYAIFICTENNIEFRSKLRKKKFLIYGLLFLSFVLISVAEFVLPLYFKYNGDIVHYVYGPALDGVAIVLAVILAIIIIPILIKNWKNIDLKKLSPIFIATVLELITLIVSGFAPYICLASISLTATCYILYMTIENPDLKLIKELELAKNQAEKSNNAKSDFLSSMSHELRTPLNAIVGLTQMIMDNDNIEEIHTDCKDILKSSNNLLELVDGILEINELESNNLEIVNSDYNPLDVFNDLIKVMGIRIGDKSIELRTRISPDLPKLLNGDKGKLKRIISNLLTNAIKYTDQGYVDLVVDVTNVKDLCNLRISVTDTGKGIKDEDVDKIFDRFYRSEDNKDSDISGTGLGLSITKSLVDLIGGKITVVSTEGSGTTFFVALSQKIVDNNDDKIEEL